MKKSFIRSFFVLILLANLPTSLAQAQSTMMGAGEIFATPLVYGMRNSAEVMKLQKFLIAREFLGGEATGNYLDLTRQAVMAFQTVNDIAPVGEFGPLTRATANKIMLANAPKPATISGTSIQYSNSEAPAALLAKEKIITWQTNGFPIKARVTINLLRKISDIPKSFVHIKSIAINTPNDGQERWIPLTEETANDMYIEVVCSSTDIFPQGCLSSSEPIKVSK